MAGGLGGSYENAYFGWKKQLYGGPLFVRLRGDSTSTAFSYSFYGDTLDVYWSRETDVGAASVTVDGVVYAYGEAGPQAYSQRTRISVPLGVHAVTFNPPSSGYAYLERYEAYNSQAVGIEIIDATLGGTKLADAVYIKEPTGNQIAGIAIEGDNGLNAIADIADIDLFLFSGPVNDAGFRNGTAPGQWARTGDYGAALGKVFDRVRARGVPVIGVVEMAGHYAMPLDGGNGNNFAAYAAAKAAILAEATGGVSIIDWDATNRMTDFAAYAAAYYPGASNVNNTTQTYTGDFIHPNDAGYVPLDEALTARTRVPIWSYSTLTLEQLRRYRTLPEDTPSTATVTVDGVLKTLPVGGACVQRMANRNGQARVIPWYLDPSATNIWASLAAEIDASATSDAFGKYITASNRTVNIATGTYKLCVTGSGSLTMRCDNANSRMRIDGVNIPFTDVTYSRTEAAFTVGTAGSTEPIIAHVDLAYAAGSYLVLSGRIYDVALVKSDKPVMVRNPS